MTLTTTGYGDLTAASGLGRAVAVLEALLGQLYLVTVVAVIVSRLARRPTSDVRKGASPDDGLASSGSRRGAWWRARRSPRPHR